MKLMLVLLCSVITLKAEPVISLEISNLVFIMVLTHLITSWHILKSISATIFTFISHNSKSVIDFSHFLARSVCYCMMSGNAMLIFQWFIVSSYTDSSWGPLAVESVETTESRVWLGWQHRCGPVPLVWRVWLYPWNSPPSRGCCTLAATVAAPGPGDSTHYWCWGHWPLVSTLAEASTWSCSNSDPTMLGWLQAACRRTSSVSPISSIQLHQQM